MEIDEELKKHVAAHIAHTKLHQWRWVTASALITDKPCVLVFCALTASGNTADITLYDGEDTNGDIICVMETTANQTRQVNFAEHIYCKTGLYVGIGSNVTGILIVWHPLKHSQ